MGSSRLNQRTMGILLIALVTFGCVAGSGGTANPPTAPGTSAPSALATARASLKPAASIKVPLYDPNADPRADIALALKAAKGDGKRVLLDFGADWCPDCHALAAYMDGPAGRNLVEPAFHVVSIDVGYWDHNLDVAGDYGSPIAKGIPAVVVLEPDGSVVGSSADGSLASASGMTEQQVLSYLARWAP
jgi:thiol-disulfide isomerase/thioredoxin